MEQGHEAHGGMSRNMARKHYVTLLLNVLISTAVMYLLMFEMIRSWGEFIQNINFFYMALTMAMPMGILMLIMMGPKCPIRVWNVGLYAGFGLVFILSFVAVREQSLVGDKQFVRSMIPHHSSAVLMCTRASIRDPEIRQLCFRPNGIVASQSREIAQMNAILKRL